MSSRNSEVIHAGIYYPSNSQKAVHCVRGRERLYAYCRQHSVGHDRLGKLIVATSDAQRDTLGAIARQAAANGVDDLRLLERAEVLRLEPALHAVAALHSPSTGIVDSHGLMLALQGDAEDRGALIAFQSRVTGGTALAGDNGGIELCVEDASGSSMTFQAGIVVNSAGLDAQGVARTIGGMPDHAIPPLYYARGCYFTMSERSPFSHLIYPVPEEGGLGVHVTLDLAGQCRFGPDVEWIDTLDYTVDPAPRRPLLPRDPELLAGSAGRDADARVRRDSTEGRRAGATGRRLHGGGAAAARRRRPRAPLWNRIARTDVGVEPRRRSLRGTGISPRRGLARPRLRRRGGAARLHQTPDHVPSFARIPAHVRLH